VIFLRGGPRRRELVLGGDRHTFLSFRFLSCELATLPYERFRESDNIVARINLPNMQVAPEYRVEAYASALQGLMRLEADPEKQLKYFDFIDIYADLDDNEHARYELEYPEEAEIMGTFSERYIQQGMERGEQLGVRKGEARVLLTQLQLKFGEVPDSVRAAIDEADAETLLRWSTQVLTATTFDEVLADNR
jgi:antitoxin component HigA of HigAB toxin-antitoxin module